MHATLITKPDEYEQLDETPLPPLCPRVVGFSLAILCLLLGITIFAGGIAWGITFPKPTYTAGSCLITSCQYIGTSSNCKSGYCPSSSYILHYFSRWNTTGKYDWTRDGEDGNWCAGMNGTDIRCYRYQGKIRVMPPSSLGWLFILAGVLLGLAMCILAVCTCARTIQFC